jgi:hypothetical protein
MFKSSHFLFQCSVSLSQIQDFLLLLLVLLLETCNQALALHAALQITWQFVAPTKQFLNDKLLVINKDNGGFDNVLLGLYRVFRRFPPRQFQKEIMQSVVQPLDQDTQVLSSVCFGNAMFFPHDVLKSSGAQLSFPAALLQRPFAGPLFWWWE